MSDSSICGLCGGIIDELTSENDKMTSGCNHEFHIDCWNKMYSTEEKRLQSKSSRIHLWLAMKCPVCNTRNFIDGNSVNNDEYIELLVGEVCKQTKGYSKCLEEIEVLEEKYNSNNAKHKKIMDNYNKMCEHIALKIVNN
mgnify:CR=1 FL=1